MAQAITIWGASYTDVPAIELPKTGGGTARFDDASITTATASDVAQGKVFVASDGTVTTGTASGGGSSAWTKVAETSYQLSTTSTSATTVDTWATGHSEIWTADKWVYVRIRDTAGLRDDYFFGSDQFFYNSNLVNGGSSSNISSAIRIYTYYSGAKITTISATGTAGNGVWADCVYSDGRIRIRQRYNSSNSHTIDGTYKVEVYLLEPPEPIFE